MEIAKMMSSTRTDGKSKKCFRASTPFFSDGIKHIKSSQSKYNISTWKKKMNTRKKLCGRFFLIEIAFPLSHGTAWDMGQGTVLCPTFLPPWFAALISLLSISRRSFACQELASHQNTPRAFALGVPCYGFNCVGLGGTRNRPLSHVLLARAFLYRGKKIFSCRKVQ